MAAPEQSYRGKGLPGHFSFAAPTEGATLPRALATDQVVSVPGTKPLDATARFGRVERFAQEHPQDTEALRIYAHGIGAPGVFAYMISPVEGFDTERDYLLSQIHSYLDMYASQGEGEAPRWETQQIANTPLSPGWKMTDDGWEINGPQEYQDARNRALETAKQVKEYRKAQQAALEAERAAYEVPLGTDIFGTVLPLPGNVTKMAARIQRDSRRLEEAGEPVTFNERVDEVAKALNLTALHERNSVVRVTTFMAEFSPLAQVTNLTLEDVQGVFSQVAPVVRKVIAEGDKVDLEHLWFVFTRDSREPMPRQDNDLRAALGVRIDKAQTAVAEKIAQRRVSNPYVPPYITQAFTHDIPVKTVPVLTPGDGSQTAVQEPTIHAAKAAVLDEGEVAEEIGHDGRVFRSRPFSFGWRRNRAFDRFTLFR